MNRELHELSSALNSMTKILSMLPELENPITRERFRYHQPKSNLLESELRKFRSAIFELTLDEKKYNNHPEIVEYLSLMKDEFLYVAGDNSLPIAYTHLESLMLHSAELIDEYLNAETTVEELSDPTLSPDDIITDEELQRLKMLGGSGHRDYINKLFTKCTLQAISESDETQEQIDAMKQVRSMMSLQDQDDLEIEVTTPDSLFLNAVRGLLFECRSKQSLSSNSERHSSEQRSRRDPEILEDCVDLLLRLEKKG